MNTKMTLGKRFLSVLLTLIMVLSMAPVSVFAANGGEAEVITVGGATVTFNNYTDAVGYANRNGGTLRLLADIEVPASENLDDILFITGEFTLDLNGKSINFVDVGSYGYDEEADEMTKGTPGTLTVTDSVGGGKIEYLMVNAGALTLESGSVADLKAESYAATVNITGGDVEYFTLNDGEGEEVSATVSGGVIRNTSINGGKLTVDGGDYREIMSLRVDGGTTNIVGGTFADLRLMISFGEIRLTGGTFTKISTELEAGSSEYKEPTLASLLGDGCAFYGADNGGIVNADVLTLENVRIIADHEHSYSGGKCTGCGAPCPHVSVDNATGICKDCDTQLEAKVTYTGKAPMFYTSFRSAIDSVLHNQKAQVTVTLLNYKYNLGNETLYLENNNNIRLDLNGHTMSGNGRIVVGENSALTVANGELDSKLTVEVAGDLTVEDDCDGVGTIRVTNAESLVTICGGDIGKLSLPATDTESLKNIKLSGGYFENISFTGGQTVVITDLLEVGYALKDNKGILKTSPGGLVSYGLNISASTYLAELEVVKCEHSEVNESKGYCNFCGKLYAGKITDKNGAVRYVEELQESDFGDGNTIVLLKNIEGVIIPGSSCTIDLNGRTVSQISFMVQDGTLTLKGYGKITVVVLGYQETDSTLVIEQKSFANRIEIGTLSVNKTTKTKLTSGQFDKIERKDGLYVEDLLADGYAFFDNEWMWPEYVSGKTSTSKTYYIYTHEHWFIVNIEGEVQCQECGMPCHHTTIGADGKCEDVCKRQIYVATLTKADGTTINCESFADAWIAAVENEGSTLKLLCDITLNKVENGIIAQSGKFTFDLNGKTVSGEITNQLLTVSGTAEITVRNGKLVNTFSKDGPDMNQTCANALEIDGGTVTLDEVELTAGHGFEGARSYAAYIFSGSLTVVDGTFTGALAVADVWGVHPSVKITSATLNNGIFYDRTGITAIDYAGLKAFFADGSMLFDKDGKYIDVGDEAYWKIEGEGEDAYVSFGYGEECVIKPHTHDTYVDGKCAECNYVCPHDSGKNDREAGYFEKAICAVCHSEYGDFAPDTTAPTGEIKIKERTWWQSLLNTISFGLFFNEEVTVTITADDDSYNQPGYDETKHAVKIEYLISNTALSAETVKGSTFEVYTGTIDLSDDDEYVIYVKLTDHAGNVAYASTEGFVIDTIPPTIENMVDGGHYTYCQKTTIKISDKNIKTITLDGRERSLNSDGELRLEANFNGKEQTQIVTDKAGNTLTVYITGYTEHDFDEETLTCRRCGIDAAAKLTADDFTSYYATVNAAISDGLLYRDENAVVTLLRSVKNGDPNAADISLWASSASLTLDLNGYELGGGNFTISGGNTGTTTIISSKPGGALKMSVYLRSPGATLIVGEGFSETSLSTGFFQDSGVLKIYGGYYSFLYVYSGEKKTELYGGKFKKIKTITEGVTCADLLAPEYCYEGVSYADAKAAATLENVTVVPCAHYSLDENGCCTDCGFHLALAVEKDGVSKNFETVESAISYAEKNAGCTVKLLQDITLSRENIGSWIYNDYINLATGTYTLDLAGKTLTIGDGVESLYGLKVTDGCDLTVTDTAGGGKIKSSFWGEMFEVRSDSHLTIESGDYTELSKVLAWGPDCLTIKGGKFKQIASKEDRNSVSPLTYLADGCAFMLSSGMYANESNLNSQYISGRGTMYWIENVTVVSAPLIFHSQPRDKVYYLTMPNYEKWAAFAVEYSGGYPPKGDITVTGERTDGTVVYTNTVKPTRIFEDAINLWEFTTADSGQFRIKLEYNGYVLYSNTFTITMAVCEHPDYYEDYGCKCTQCHCDLAAAIVKGGKTTGYVNFADALAAAQTDENKGCVLWLLTDVTEKVTVSGGDFKFGINGHTIGGLGVTKTAKLNIFSGTVSGTINGAVTVAKNASLVASVLTITGTVNDSGNMSSFINCTFDGVLNARGSNTNINGCMLNSTLTVSSKDVTVNASSVSGKITINNGGVLQLMGNDGKYGEVLVKSGGTMKVYAGNTFTGSIMAETGSTLLLSGGEFKEITVNGQHLIDCLAEGKAFEDMVNGDVIDGRVSIAGNVRVVAHTHAYEWNTRTHEELCGCGHVKQADTTPPVAEGLTDNKTYCGDVSFTVTDDNEILSVTVNGTVIVAENGTYTLRVASGAQTVVLTDVAGNTTTITVYVNDGHDWDTIWISNGDGTHTRTCKNDATHTDTASCSGGEATCTEQAKCEICGEKYGEVDPKKHTGTPIWTLKSETKHEQKYSCCGAVTVAEESHEWENGKCVECGYVCAHKGGTATCTEQAICEFCGEKYGEVDPDNHTGTLTWTIQSETEHEQKYPCCGKVEVSRESHNWTDGKCSECGYVCTHKGGEATCTEQAKCEICGEKYGDKNPGKHTGTPIWTLKSETKHEQKYSCCGAVTVAEESHEWENGKCTECDYVCAHKGGTATCTEQATCEFCGEKYGEVDPDNHTGALTWTIQSETEHEQKYSCCNKVEVSRESHNWTDGKCTKCGYVCVHSGGEATCTEQAKCEICGEKYGEVDPGRHTGGKEWTLKSETKHEQKYSCCGAVTVAEESHEWENGKCTECDYVCAHKGGEATCTEQATCEFCGEKYGEVDPDNHTGTLTWTIQSETEHEQKYSCCHVTKVPKEPHEWSNGKCTECGYTCAHKGGEATCNSLAKCEICGARYGNLDFGNHMGSAEWVRTSTEHTQRYSCCGAEIIKTEAHTWVNGACFVCGYGCEHIGGEADCHTRATCSKCGSKYGQYDSSKHTGGTEVRDAKSATCTEAGYTGDTYCRGCNAKLADGTVIAAIGHKGGKATCHDKAVCDACGAQYGELDPNNHASLERVEATSATVTSTGSKAYWRCRACGKIYADADGKTEMQLDDTIIDKLPPEIIEGMNSVWTKADGSSDSLTFKSNAAFADFISVLVDGRELTADQYDKREGSIIVELKAAYLETLSEGEHTLTIRSASGDATTTFTVNAASTPAPVEQSNAWIYIVIAVAAVGIAAAVVIIIVVRKKKKAN